MPDDTSILAAHSRDASAAAARSASATKARANKKASAPTRSLNLAELFGPPKE